MKRKIIGNTVGTTISPSKIGDELKPVKTVNGQAPDENGNVAVKLPPTVTDEHINALIDAKLATLPTVATYNGEVEVV